MTEPPPRCLPAGTPLLIRERGLAAVRTPAELVAPDAAGPAVQTFAPAPLLDAWDGSAWTPIQTVTAVRPVPDDPAHKGLGLQSRAAILHVCAGTLLLDAAGSRLEAGDANPGRRLHVAESFPPTAAWTALTPETGELLGRLAAAGTTDASGTLRFTGPDPTARTRVAELWSRCFGGIAAERDDGVALQAGAGHLGAWLHEQLRSPGEDRRVPPLVLNATAEVAAAFLTGYDTPEDPKRASLRTPSAVLTQGICWLHALQDRKPSVFVERDADGAATYQLDPRAAMPFAQMGMMVPPTDPGEIRRVDPVAPAGAWLYDVRTESGRLLAGVGRAVVGA